MTTTVDNEILVTISDDLHDAHALLWTVQSLAVGSHDTITLPAYGFHLLIDSIREKVNRSANNLTDYLHVNG